MCIIEYNKTDKFGMLGGQISGERNDVLPLFVAASRINFLCGSCFSSDGKTWYGRGCGSTGIAYHASERVTNFFGGFMRNDLSQHHWRKRTNGFAIARCNRFHDAWRD